MPIHDLNRRWQTALRMEKQGVFDNLTEEAREKILKELMVIVKEADELFRKNPSEAYFLEDE